MAYTLGPWTSTFSKYAICGEWPGYDIHSIPEGCFEIAAVKNTFDAQLIAAAPELLEVLKELFDWSSSEYQSNPQIDAKVRTIIAKAENLEEA